VKVVAGDTPQTLEQVAKASTAPSWPPEVYRASSIKVAKRPRSIENTQRDLDIALVNELRLSSTASASIPSRSYKQPNNGTFCRQTGA